MEQPIAYKNEHGIWIYQNLPKGMKVAIRNDFYTNEGELLIGKKFLVKSFHYSRYETHTCYDNFIEKWEPWLVGNHIFISIT